MTWRVGTKLGRTLYRDEQLVGMVDTPELAAEIVAAMNACSQLDALVEWASPLSRDLGVSGGLNTIRRTMKDERATITRLGRELAEANALLREARSVIYTDDGSNLGERIQGHLAKTDDA